MSTNNYYDLNLCNNIKRLKTPCLSLYRFLQDPEDIANAQRCSKANRAKTATDSSSPASTLITADDHSSNSTDEDASLRADHSAASRNSATDTTVNALDETDIDSVESVSSDDDTVEEMVPLITLDDDTRSARHEANVGKGYGQAKALCSGGDESALREVRFIAKSPELVDHGVLIKEEPAI